MKSTQRLIHGGLCVAMLANSTLAMAQQAVQVQDGKDVTQGAKADAACAGPASTCSVVAIGKATLSAIGGPIPGGTNQIGFVGFQANVTGGCTPQFIASAATALAVQIASGSHVLCELVAINTVTTLMDIRLYDSTSTAVSGAQPCNSSTNLVANYVVQGNATSPGFAIPLGPFGIQFFNGLDICITGANASNDTTAGVAGLNVNIGWK